MNLIILAGTILAVISVTTALDLQQLKNIDKDTTRVHFVGKKPKVDASSRTNEHSRTAEKTCYDRPWWMSWEGSPARWEKLNKKPVCFGAKNNQYGSFVYGKSAFVWSFKIEYVRGYLTCNINSPSSSTYFGCGKTNPRIGVFLTDVYNRIQVPLGVNSKFYNMNGFTGNSKTLIFSTGESPFGIHSSTELRLWYGEDLFDSTESDNGGHVCINIYGLI